MSNLRPPRRIDNPEVRRVIDDLYKELNFIKDSINKAYNGAPSNSQGKLGDIAVYKDQFNKHILSVKTVNGWARIGLSVPKVTGEPFRGVGVHNDRLELKSADAIKLESPIINKPNIELKSSYNGANPAYISFIKDRQDNTAPDGMYIGGFSFTSNTATGTDASAAVTDGSKSYGALLFQATETQNDIIASELELFTYTAGTQKILTLKGDKITMSDEIQFSNTGSGALNLIGNDFTFTTLSEASALDLYLEADEGDDDEDKALISLADGGVLTYQSFIGGSTWKTLLTVTPHATPASSTVAIAGDLTVSGSKVTFGNGAIIDNGTDTDKLTFKNEVGFEFIGGDDNNEPLNLYLQADKTSPDNSDLYNIQINATTSVFAIQNKASGSYANHLSIVPNTDATASTTAVAGNLTVGNNLTTTGDLTVEGDDIVIGGSNDATDKTISFRHDDAYSIIGVDNSRDSFSIHTATSFPLSGASDIEISAAGVVSIRESIIVGDATNKWSDGYHGNDTFIALLPSDFNLSSDSSRTHGVYTDDDGGGVKNPNAGNNYYAMKIIPKGFTATVVHVYCDVSLGGSSITVSEGQIDDDSVTSKGTGNTNADIDITDVDGDGTNYIIIKVDPIATSNEIRGGKITIARTAA